MVKLLLMRIQIRHLTETLVTHIADMRLLISVCSNVNLEVILLIEHLITQLATVRLYTRMGPFMYHKTSCTPCYIPGRHRASHCCVFVCACLDLQI